MASRRRPPAPGRPTRRERPDPADAAEPYSAGEEAAPPEPDEDLDEMATGTVQDQLVYEELEGNRAELPPPAEAKASRKRSPLKSPLKLRSAGAAGRGSVPGKRRAKPRR